jgi:hypothetical protein
MYDEMPNAPIVILEREPPEKMLMKFSMSTFEKMAFMYV